MFGFASSDEDNLDPEHEGDTRMYFGRLMPKEWQFLYRWFETVSGRLSIAQPQRLDSHAVELGRDLKNDVWIEVEHDGGMVSKYDELAEDSVKRYSTLREMLILTTILADVHYDVWYGELRRGARFMTPKFFDLKHHQLERKYAFGFYGTDDPCEYSWDVLQNLFSHDKFSDEFQEHFRVASDAAKTQGVDVSAMKTIPIMFIVKLQENERRSDQVLIIKNLTKTVLKILDLEAKHIADVATSTSVSTAAVATSARTSKRATATTKRKAAATALRAPVFHLECMDLDFRKFSYHTTVMTEIQKLVETGVRVKSLTLPSQGAKYSQEKEEKQRLVWASFLCEITGQPQENATEKKKMVRRRPVRLDRIVLVSNVCMESNAVMLCSTLATARGVKSVRFEQSLYNRKYGVAHWRLWSWIAYALFSRNSKSSVEVLEIGGFQLTHDDVTALEETMQSVDPLATLWRHSTSAKVTEEDTNVRSQGRAVVVAAGSMLTPLGLQFAPTVVSVCDWRGVLVTEDVSSSTADVLLPGFGLCRVDCTSLPNKRQKREDDCPIPPFLVGAEAISAKTVTTLVLALRPRKTSPFRRLPSSGEAKDSIAAKPFVARLLQLIGGPLTALSLQANDVDEACVDECLSHCPKLRSLRLGGVSLATMDPLVRAYIERHAKIASLELSDIKALPADGFENFLLHLATERSERHPKDPIQSCLRKLRFGKGWSARLRPETAALMETIMACADGKLTYVDTFSDYGNRSHDQRCLFRLKKFRGKILEDGPLDHASRVAFLSVFHHTRHDCQPRLEPLSHDLIRTIFGFAAPHTARMVVDQSDFSRLYSGSDDEYD